MFFTIEMALFKSRILCLLEVNNVMLWIDESNFLNLDPLEGSRIKCEVMKAESTNDKDIMEGDVVEYPLPEEVRQAGLYGDQIHFGLGAVNELVLDPSSSCLFCHLEPLVMVTLYPLMAKFDIVHALFLSRNFDVCFFKIPSSLDVHRGSQYLPPLKKIMILEYLPKETFDLL